ncbi:MAG: hypothetical protein J6S22_02965 [Clostridia bacterium]|nr:hypothetical protein [Clostridia bacterium]
MNRENYDILGVSPSASDDEITAKYNELKDKYEEERWLDGERGNNAARMLGKIQTAYNEIMSERRERVNASGNTSDILDRVANDIKNGDLVGAQAKLDECNERGGEWHYLQSVIFFRKNWMNESKKQLEIAMQIDPFNSKYKDAYDRINQRMNYQGQSAYNQGQGGAYNQGQGGGYTPQQEQQMGGSGCAQCVDCCYTYLCINCLFDLCCGCR